MNIQIKIHYHLTCKILLSDMLLWWSPQVKEMCVPRYLCSWGQHGAHPGPVGPRWAPCWPHEPCYQGRCLCVCACVFKSKLMWGKLTLWHLVTTHMALWSWVIIGSGNGLPSSMPLPEPMLNCHQFDLNIKLVPGTDFHDKDKTVMRPSYLYNGNPYTGKNTSLYWDGPQDHTSMKFYSEYKHKCMKKY